MFPGNATPWETTQKLLDRIEATTCELEHVGYTYDDAMFGAVCWEVGRCAEPHANLTAEHVPKLLDLLDRRFRDRRTLGTARGV